MVDLCFNLKQVESNIRYAVDKAFKKVYIPSEDTYYRVTEIMLDYVTSDDEWDAPIVTVVVDGNSRLEGEFHIEMSYTIEETIDYNVGHMASAFERVESD